jgi:hypothetical protein
MSHQKIIPDLNSLNNYVARVKRQPFAWFSNDCLTFTNGAFKAMYGKGWADDWVGKYHKGNETFKRDQLRKIFKARTIEEAISGKLTRVDGLPPKGCLVLTDQCRRWVIGKAMGIAWGRHALFLNDDGLEALPIENITSAWNINEV